MEVLFNSMDSFFVIATAEGFVQSPQFIVGGIAGLILGFLIGKVVGSSGKAKEVRKRMGV